MMSEIEKRKADYIFDVANGEYADSVNWAFVFMFGNLIETTRKENKNGRKEN